MVGIEIKFAGVEKRESRPTIDSGYSEINELCGFPFHKIVVKVWLQ